MLKLLANALHHITLLLSAKAGKMSLSARFTYPLKNMQIHASFLLHLEVCLALT